ncbi:hypothetical protein POVWA1_043330 [Plasmodium ovale wallikeri]|uniref:Uncharacterized protein n=1 Tax=Plasmodium ovale wallikeri TaxID=864142 RepID=A0A1A8ZAW2_PLAOA|nr:hypothetical protein POVWA1_043330 [Plasmodium ovale wallikeri]
MDGLAGAVAGVVVDSCPTFMTYWFNHIYDVWVVSAFTPFGTPPFLRAVACLCLVPCLGQKRGKVLPIAVTLN